MTLNTKCLNRLLSGAESFREAHCVPFVFFLVSFTFLEPCVTRHHLRNFVYMDDLKPYASITKQYHRMSCDIGLIFGIRKWKPLKIFKGKFAET